MGLLNGLNLMEECSMKNIIPELKLPAGVCWNQPELSEVLIDDELAVMAYGTFYKLAEYDNLTYNVPTLRKAGVMWKVKYKDGYYLKWYSDSRDERGLDINSRKILIVN